jgi:hypothetical protein
VLAGPVHLGCTCGIPPPVGDIRICRDPDTYGTNLDWYGRVLADTYVRLGFLSDEERRLMIWQADSAHWIAEVRRDLDALWRKL